MEFRDDLFTCSSCGVIHHTEGKADIPADPNARHETGPQPEFCQTCHDDSSVIGLDTTHTFTSETYVFQLPMHYTISRHWDGDGLLYSPVDRCSCDIKVLMDYGCQCGNAQKELAAERDRRNDG